MRKKEAAGDVDKVFVTGCLSERYKPDLEAEIPDVDRILWNTLNCRNFLKALGADYKHELIGERLTTTPKQLCVFKNCGRL